MVRRVPEAKGSPWIRNAKQPGRMPGLSALRGTLAGQIELPVPTMSGVVLQAL